MTLNRVQVSKTDINPLQTITNQHAAHLRSIETAQRAMQSHLCDMQLQMEDAENRSRRNNICLRGSQKLLRVLNCVPRFWQY